MKNASLMLICCILFVFTLALSSKQIYHLFPQKNNEFTIKVYDVKKNTNLIMSLQEYSWRVAAKEMPVSFHDEAIKAQIIAARTYALRKIQATKHQSGADVCTDFNHCTAFLVPGTERNTFGTKHKSICEQFQNLSNSTSNQIITFDNQPILAVFHATSSGITEKSSDVWQTQLPYLTNVDSSLDKNSPNFETTYKFKEEELESILKTNPPFKFEIISYTDSGSIKEIKVNNIIYKGTEIRNMLNLRSSNFSIEQIGEITLFNVKGYGHGVGMSQTGANEYAKQGLNYKEILLKYYPGTKIIETNIFNNISNVTKK